MVCKYCGAETENENRICNSCAAKLNADDNDIFSSSSAQPHAVEQSHAERVSHFVEAEDAEMYHYNFSPTTRRPRKSRRKIAIVAAVAVVLLAAVITIGIINSPSAQIEKLLRGGDNDTAYSMFVKHFNKNGSLSLNNRLIDIAEDTVTEYLSGTIDYTVASARLETIKKMGITEVVKPLEKAEKNLQTAYNSKQSFKRGEEFWAKKNYAAAISEYEAVIKDDSNYSAARTRLESAISKYRNTVLSDAATFVADGDYDAAVSLLETAEEILKDDALVEKRITEYRKASASKTRTEVIDTADRYSDREDYAAAIRIILTEIAKNSEFGEDTTVKANLAYYRDCYKKQAVEKLETLADSKKYDEAGELIAEAQTLLGENDEIEKIKAELSGKLPTMLYTEVPTDSTDWQLCDGSAVDAFGFDRGQNGDCYALGATSKATYAVKGDYKTFTCNLIAAKNMNSSASARVRVTATVGGEYRYRECVVKPTGEAQTLKINITDCTAVEISVSGDGAALLLYGGRFGY